MTTSGERIARSPAAIGRAIKLRREELHLTQEQLARRGITNRYAVMKLEEGSETKALQALFDILYALDLELVVRPKQPGPRQDQ